MTSWRRAPNLSFYDLCTFQFSWWNFSEISQFVPEDVEFSAKIHLRSLRLSQLWLEILFLFFQLLIFLLFFFQTFSHLYHLFSQRVLAVHIRYRNFRLISKIISFQICEKFYPKVWWEKLTDEIEKLNQKYHLVFLKVLRFVARTFFPSPLPHVVYSAVRIPNTPLN